VFCVDAKINFDDNAQFRQQDLFAMRDFTMEDPREVSVRRGVKRHSRFASQVAASKFNLNYVGLDGNIGCMGKCTLCPRDTPSLTVNVDQ
jgi:succinyl-CoA synthetase beta subunit